jgi:hypothetical protein
MFIEVQLLIGVNEQGYDHRKTIPGASFAMLIVTRRLHALRPRWEGHAER